MKNPPELKNVSRSYKNEKLKLLIYLTKRKKNKSFLEIEKLDKTLQSLHLDVIASQQKHKVELAQLEQQITKLERDLRDARNFIVKMIRYAFAMRMSKKLSLQKSHCKCEETGHALPHTHLL